MYFNIFTHSVTTAEPSIGLCLPTVLQSKCQSDRNTSCTLQTPGVYQMWEDQPTKMLGQGLFFKMQKGLLCLLKSKCSYHKSLNTVCLSIIILKCLGEQVCQVRKKKDLKISQYFRNLSEDEQSGFYHSSLQFLYWVLRI